MNRRFVIADVFTDRAFAGNPLAVVLDTEGLDGESMQRIANEFNLSETTFVQAAEGDRARVRIFTPAREVPFAGHPTIGTALVLARRRLIAPPDEGGTVVLDEVAGEVPVQLRREGDAFVHAELEAPGAPSFHDAPSAEDLAAVIGLEPADLTLENGLPEGASVGLAFLILEVRDQGALARARVDGAAFERVLGGSPDTGLYVVTRDGGDADFRVRMFAPRAGVPEDPATGSAAAALGGWLGERGGLGDGEHGFVVAQGVEMGRPSRIEVTVVRDGGVLRAVRVGGGAVEVMAGELLV